MQDERPRMGVDRIAAYASRKKKRGNGGPIARRSSSVGVGAHGGDENKNKDKGEEDKGDGDDDDDDGTGSGSKRGKRAQNTEAETRGPRQGRSPRPLCRAYREHGDVTTAPPSPRTGACSKRRPAYLPSRAAPLDARAVPFDDSLAGYENEDESEEEEEEEEEARARTTIDDLPTEMVEAILSHLRGSATATVSAQVCRLWRALVVGSAWDRQRPRGAGLAVALAESGCTHLLGWLAPHDRTHAIDWRRVVCAAAEAGRVEVLRWVWMRKMRRLLRLGPACSGVAGVNLLLRDPEDEPTHCGHRFRSDRCVGWVTRADGSPRLRDSYPPWMHGVYTSAARRGRIEVLNWAHANGMPWCKGFYIAAAEAGHLDAIRWGEEHGHPIDDPEEVSGMFGVFTSAARRGHLPVVIWAFERGRCPSWLESGVSCAVLFDHPHVVDWLYRKTATMGQRGRYWGVDGPGAIARMAATLGSLEVLEWVRANGASWDAWDESEVVRIAATRKHEHILRWVQERGLQLQQQQQ